MDFFRNDPLFDLDGNGIVDEFETMAAIQMTASSREEAIELTGDDTYYSGSDSLEDEEAEMAEELELAGLDYDELECMDDEERRAILDDAGLDPDDFDF